MATAFEKLMALMSFNAYRPSPQNAFALESAGWKVDVLLSCSNRGDGFDATVFRSASGQVVISFRGTDGPSPADWSDKNIPEEEIEGHTFIVPTLRCMFESHPNH